MVLVGTSIRKDLDQSLKRLQRHAREVESTAAAVEQERADAHRQGLE